MLSHFLLSLALLLALQSFRLELSGQKIRTRVVLIAFMMVVIEGWTHHRTDHLMIPAISLVRLHATGASLILRSSIRIMACIRIKSLYDCFENITY